MRTFIGIFLASFSNFVFGFIGFCIVNSSSLITLAPKFNPMNSTFDYLWSFLLKFLVISIITWIMYRVMAMLDNPKKRVLFVFLIGSSLSVYNEVNLFFAEPALSWSLIIILGESLNWLITGYVLSKFVRPKHLGAL